MRRRVATAFCELVVDRNEAIKVDSAGCYKFGHDNGAVEAPSDLAKAVLQQMAIETSKANTAIWRGGSSACARAS